MTLKMKTFTPDVLITAPRRGGEAPSDDASALLFEESKYSFEDEKTTSRLRMALFPYGARDLDTTSRASNAVWLNPSLKGERGAAVLFLREREEGKEKGVIDLMCLEDVFEDKLSDPYVVGSFEGPVDNLKITKLGEAYYGIAVTGKANPNGTLYNAHTAAKAKSTAKLYKSLFLRHWDEYVTPQRNSIFFAALVPKDSSSLSSHLFMTSLNNALRGTGIESPIPTFGGGDHFDISPTGLTFVAKDPDLDPALHTKCNVYLVPLSNFLETTPTLYTVEMGDVRGAMTSPRFNVNGTKVVFLAMRKDGYEADRNEIFVVEDTTRPAWISHYRASTEAKKEWDRSPDSINFSHDGKQFLVTADDIGYKAAFTLPVDVEDSAAPYHIPIAGGSISAVVPLPDGKIFATGSNFVDSSWYYHVDLTSKDTPTRRLSTPIENDQHQTLGPIQGASHTIYSHSSVTGSVQYWEIRPYGFDTSKSYPLALLVHGGPQGSWNISWSTRWNPAVFAEQGYVVVCPNITGSTGFGQEFTDSIQASWGGRPCQDLENVFEHLERNVDYIDTERAVALGASYGGYMMNWVQGQPLGRKFKALVTHDGVFSFSFELATDELYFVNHEFRGGWDPSNKASREAWAEYDPSLHTHNWETPHLIIHSEKDYRLTMADGLATFNILQQRGVESEFLTFSDENHFVTGRENSLRWHEVVFSFINKHVGLHIWERQKGDIDEIRMDPNLRTKEEERVKVANNETTLVRR